MPPCFTIKPAFMGQIIVLPNKFWIFPFSKNTIFVNISVMVQLILLSFYVWCAFSFFFLNTFFIVPYFPLIDSMNILSVLSCLLIFSHIKVGLIKYIFNFTFHHIFLICGLMENKTKLKFNVIRDQSVLGSVHSKINRELKQNNKHGKYGFWKQPKCHVLK